VDESYLVIEQARRPANRKRGGARRVAQSVGTGPVRPPVYGAYW
jgi:hypothetical protein